MLFENELTLPTSLSEHDQFKMDAKLINVTADGLKINRSDADEVVEEFGFDNAEQITEYVTGLLGLTIVEDEFAYA